MLKRTVIIVLLLICSVSVFGQDKPRLGILPFTGGPGGDGETISTLIAYQREMLEAFTLVPLTNAVRAMVNEPSYQFSSVIDSDMIALMGRMLNADYVISGQIRRLAHQNLLIMSIVDVKTFKMAAGLYRVYNRLDEIPGMLPEITQKLVASTRRDTSRLPNLTIAPPVIADGGLSRIEAEALVQILLIEIAETGKYSIVPRLTTNQSTMKELDFQLMGRAVNSRYILTSEVRQQGMSNMVTASIFNVEDGAFLPGGFRTYYAMDDGVTMMAELAKILTGLSAVQLPPAPTPAPSAPAPAPAAHVPAAPAHETAPAPPPPPPPPPLPLEPEDEEPVKEEPAEALPEQEPVRVQVPVAPDKPTPPKKPAKQIDPQKYWTIGFSAGSSFAVPAAVASVYGTIAPFNNIFLEIGCDVGLLTLSDLVKMYYSITPFGHLAYFMPFKSKGGWYAGAGGSFMMAKYTMHDYPAIENAYNIFALDAIAGVNLFNFVNISYTFRVITDFKAIGPESGINHKLALGLTYRF